MFELLYEELCAVAQRYMGKERIDHTLQPTALVHEAFLRLRQQRKVRFENRDEFLGIAAVTIRRVLVNHAKAHLAAKRGGSRNRFSIRDDHAITPGPDLDLLALDEALSRLGDLSERQCRIVELLFFGGLKIDTVARVLGVSARTVDGDWAMARYWLQEQLTSRTRP